MQEPAATPTAHPSTARTERLPEPSGGGLGGYLGTPRGQIVLAVVFWVIAGATAAAALLLLRQADFATPTRRIIAHYAAFGVSTLFILLSIVMLLVGAVRWAILGPHAPAGEHLGTAELRRDLALISDRLLLSETAKKVAFRREDVSLLHRTIRQDIAEHDFNAAMVLVEALGSFYGQLPEAEAFREEIRKMRAADQEAQVEAGVLEMDRILARHDFTGARREADRLTRLYPDAQGADGLHEWVDRAKAQYKLDLEADFIEAKDRGEIDKALDLMTRLDKMLTPAEAEPFREAAREVFAKKRDNLGLQFKLAVHDKEWNTAVEVGEEIMGKFPNSRMADEVRELIGVLRGNAAGGNAAAPTPQTPAGDAPAAPSPPPAQG